MHGSAFEYRRLLKRYSLYSPFGDSFATFGCHLGGLPSMSQLLRNGPKKQHPKRLACYFVHSAVFVLPDDERSTQFKFTLPLSPQAATVSLLLPDVVARRGLATRIAFSHHQKLYAELGSHYCILTSGGLQICTIYPN
jgi:hypothetical protein